MRSRWYVMALVASVGGASLLGCRPESDVGAARLAPLEPDRISLRVVDAGAPLGEAEVQVSIEQWSLSRNGWLGSSRDRKSTDADGRLTVKLSGQGSPEEAHPTEFRVIVVHGHRYGELRSRHGPGATELGDLTLEPMPVLAAGHLMNHDGTPASAADLFVVDDDRTRASTWHLEWCKIAADSDGEFVLHTPRPLQEAQLRLLARREDWVSPVTAVAEGERDLTLALSIATGGLTGRVLVDPEVPPEKITVQLYASELGALAPGWGLFELESHPDSEGRFSLVGRVPGRHTIRVLACGKEVLTLDDVLVEPGPPGTDPRLDPIDLRGKLQARRIRLLVPDETVVPEGLLRVHCRDEGECGSEFFRGAELLVLCSDPAPDVELFLRDFRAMRLEKVSADRTVPLVPGWPIRLVLDDDIALPAPPIRWLVTLKGDRFSSFWTSPIEFAAGRREARGVALTTGELEVGWIRCVATESVPVFGTFGGQRGWPRQTVHVRDVPEEQVLRLGWVPVAP
ncbi:MAG TPA: hypothetical protein VF530_18030 [Planctomycetota bacterium]